MASTSNEDNRLHDGRAGVRKRHFYKSDVSLSSKDDRNDQDTLLGQVKRVVLKCAVGTEMDRFSLGGGAERAAFVTVVNVDHTSVPYRNSALKISAERKSGFFLRLLELVRPPLQQFEVSSRLEGQFAPGDLLLTVGGGCVVGFRLVECAALISALVGGGEGELVIEILPKEALQSTSLRRMVELGLMAEPHSFEWTVRKMMRINLERDIVPCTTRPRRPSDAKYGDYFFVQDHFFNKCEDQLTMIDFGTYAGYRYGYERPYAPFDPRKAQLTAEELNKYLNCKIPARNNSFNEALGYALTEEERDRSKAKPSYFSPKY